MGQAGPGRSTSLTIMSSTHRKFLIVAGEGGKNASDADARATTMRRISNMVEGWLDIDVDVVMVMVGLA